MKNFIFIMGITCFTLFPFFVFGQLLDPVDYFIIDSPDTVKAGEVFNISIEANIDDNWHLYSISNDPDAGPFPTQFSSNSSQMSIAGKVEESEPEIAYDPNFETELGWHSNSAKFKVPIAFRKNLQGVEKISLEVLYQVCDDRSCLPPKTKQINKEVILESVSKVPFQGYRQNNEDSLSVSDRSTDTENATDLTVVLVEYFWLITAIFLSISFLYILFQKKNQQINE